MRLIDGTNIGIKCVLQVHVLTSSPNKIIDNKLQYCIGGAFHLKDPNADRLGVETTILPMKTFLWLIPGLTLFQVN